MVDCILKISVKAINKKTNYLTLQLVSPDNFVYSEQSSSVYHHEVGGELGNQYTYMKLQGVRTKPEHQRTGMCSFLLGVHSALVYYLHRQRIQNDNCKYSWTEGSEYASGLYSNFWKKSIAERGCEALTPDGETLHIAKEIHRKSKESKESKESFHSITEVECEGLKNPIELLTPSELECAIQNNSMKASEGKTEKISTVSRPSQNQYSCSFSLDGENIQYRFVCNKRTFCGQANRLFFPSSMSVELKKLICEVLKILSGINTKGSADESLTYIVNTAKEEHNCNMTIDSDLRKRLKSNNSQFPKERMANKPYGTVEVENRKVVTELDVRPKGKTVHFRSVFFSFALGAVFLGVDRIFSLSLLSGSFFQCLFWTCLGLGAGLAIGLIALKIVSSHENCYKNLTLFSGFIGGLVGVFAGVDLFVSNTSLLKSLIAQMSPGLQMATFFLALLALSIWIGCLQYAVCEQKSVPSNQQQAPICE